MSTCQCDDGTPASNDSALGALLDSTQNAAATKQEFNTRIAQVRARYFESQPGTPEYASIERELASLLEEKDLTLAFPLITNGFSEQAQTKVELFSLLSGGEIDNGIPADAKQAFLKWVAGMRGTLGANGNNDMLAITDSNSFQQALKANSSLYEEYRAQRDTAERSVFEAEQKRLMEVETARTKVAADGGVPLKNKNVRVLASYDYGQGEMSAELDKAMMEMYRHDPLILECNYGPGLSATGHPMYYQFLYWHQPLPGNLAVVLQADTDLVFEKFGNQARTDCPLSDRAARAESTALMQTHPWYKAPTPTIPPSQPTDIRTEQRLARERQAQEKRCVAYADRLEKARVKAPSSVGATRAYANMQQIYKEQCQVE